MPDTMIISPEMRAAYVKATAPDAHVLHEAARRAGFRVNGFGGILRRDREEVQVQSLSGAIDGR